VGSYDLFRRQRHHSHGEHLRGEEALDLKSEAPRFRSRKISAAIAPDVKRFSHQIKRARVSAGRRTRRLSRYGARVSGSKLKLRLQRGRTHRSRQHRTTDSNSGQVFSRVLSTIRQRRERSHLRRRPSPARTHPGLQPVCGHDWPAVTCAPTFKPGRQRTLRSGGQKSWGDASRSPRAPAGPGAPGAHPTLAGRRKDLRPK
jgi:hypothetical protein